MIVMTAWLTFAGCTVSSAFTLVILLMTAWLVIARIIAETGLVHGVLRISMVRPWQMIVTAGFARPVSIESFYLGSILQATFYDYREVMTVYATHGMKVIDQTAPRESAPARSRIFRRAIGLMFLALLVGYVVSFREHALDRISLRLDAGRHAHDADQRSGAPIRCRDPGHRFDHELRSESRYFPQHDRDDPFHDRRGASPRCSHSFASASLVAVPSDRVSDCRDIPESAFVVQHLHRLAAETHHRPLRRPRFYTACKPFFIGLIVGEGVAAGFWLIVGIAMNAMNIPYSPVNIMPG